MVVRKRLIFWLLKAYIDKWGKTILISFVFGCIVFFLLIFFAQSLLSKIPVFKKDTIGVVGDKFTATSLPPYIQREFAKGLTVVSMNGEPKPDTVTKWDIQNNGKKYIFYLRPNVKFTDGSILTSENVAYNFSDAEVLRPQKDVVVFNLKESYAPFLTTISKPFYKKGFVGVGNYKVKDIDINGTFVKSLTLTDINNEFATKSYIFYPNEEQLKLRFVLGDVRKAVGLTDLDFKNTTFADFPNIKTTRTINYEKLVTLFYNTQDSVLSDKRLREALSYTIPDEFSNGERAYIPYSPKSWAYEDYSTQRKKDLEHAKLLFEDATSSNKDTKITVTIKVMPKYKHIAQQIAQEWKKLNVTTKIVEVDTIPSDFQIFLGDFRVPSDPDQYFLWHSSQNSNITKYENKRIDKLLEDGRKTIDITERKKLYSDFLKYFLADSPASFLYFPYEYTVERN